MYYYRTDIRNSGFGNCTGALGTDVCQDNVPKTNSDTASWQHMTTFTMGLGAFGRMDYSPTYATDSTGDYVAVKNGTLADPANGICSWGTNGQACNWPTPNVSGTPENIDDLWHAAVNGRGAYYSATNPTTLAAGLQNALSGIAARTGAAAAATTSNPNVSTGDNFLFSSTFNTAIWDGNIIRQQIDLTTGNLSATPDWSAQAKFDAGQTRTLYTYSASDTGNIKVFNWGNLTAAEKNYFALGNLGGLTQFCSSGPNCLSATDQATAAGANLVSFVMGDRTNEGALTDITKFYRLRSTAANPHPNTVLGDIVNAEAAYVKGSQSSYADTGYDTFKTTNSTRAGRVYVAANDGMLHAFDSETGTESWAYLPSFVLPNLPKLADKDYANRHQYFVDGTPSSGDVYYDGAWHTILVGGLNGGGRGYYALDVTDPTVAPTVLWEFSDANLGYTYGNPIFTKLSDGTWVVVVASGYNNVTPGDGKGYLYVLNAKTGAVIRTISTGVGNTTTPSGLAKIVGYASHPNIDNSVLRVYGGDLLGNLWRFDINAGTTQLIVTLKDSSANVQPITTTPALGDFNGLNMVYVATGKYIGVSDLSDTSQQTIYGIKDTLGTAGGALYASSRVGLTQQTVTTTTCPAGAPTSVCSSGETVRTTSSNTVNLVSGQGWYVDLPDSGERVNTDMTLTLGTLFLTSNVPNASACNSGGYSFGWQLDYRTGSAVQNTNYVSAVKIDNTLATRPIPVGLPNGAVIVYTRKSDGTTDTATGHFSLSNTIRRVNWRELTDQ
ncbi:MAG: hypothetical protein JSS58_08395 [Proteobacteria bacterium]|nr:hypothetical protein [Pseudomonadota bacterium]